MGWFFMGRKHTIPKQYETYYTKTAPTKTAPTKTAPKILISKNIVQNGP